MASNLWPGRELYKFQDRERTRAHGHARDRPLFRPHKSGARDHGARICMRKLQGHVRLVFAAPGLSEENWRSWATMKPNLNTGKPWSPMDLEDLRNERDLKTPVERIAQFLCRDVGDVEAKVAARANYSSYHSEPSQCG